MKTADRRLTLVGIKLIGLVLLCYAIVSSGQAMIAGVMFYRMYRTPQGTSSWQTPREIREDAKRESLERSRTEDSAQRFTCQIQAQQSFSKLPWLLFVALVGLYMCRNGSIVLEFLTGKDTQESQSARRD